ncbi:hypothetical protein L1987_57274 [Smallanthus sonchifolius]|uniref:Uncharacterized protein n=1 Tax=Smallanthus sonchifolius TaxID=185202 RepID=A0ACB9DCT8_9ASTR|nr:hypothetical protein L1987_57274 [Smallanthus sonchifolius]
MMFLSEMAGDKGSKKVQGKNEKEWRPVQEQTAEKSVHVGAEPMVDVQKPGTSNVGSRSFKETLLGIDPVHESVDISVPDEISCCNDGHDVGLLGRLVDFKSLSILRIWFSSSINKNVSIKYLGGLNVIVIFESVEDKAWFFKKKNLWEMVFLSLEDWEGQVIDFERLAWIKVYGIPMCLMVDSVIKDIGAIVGEVVQSSNPSDGDDWSYVLMGVLCKSVTRIRYNVRLAWKSNTFPVVVEEDPGDWVPDCLVDVEDDQSIESNGIDDSVRAEEEECNMHAEGEEGDVILENTEIKDNSQSNILSHNDNFNDDTNNEGEAVMGQENIPFCQANSLGDANLGNFKKSKGYRKKARKNVSVSPVGQDRPRKGPEVVRTYMIWTDLLIRDIIGDGALGDTEDRDVGLQAIAVMNVETQKEVEDTVALGVKLGATNIDLFEDAINKMVREEGSLEHYPDTVQEIQQLPICTRLVSGVVLTAETDKWSWNNCDLKFLSIKDTKQWVRSSRQEDSSNVMRWCKWIPVKCNVFMWRAWLDRIPTKVALSKRNINVGNKLCVMCEEAEETVDHVFAGCRVTDGIWSGIASWCRIPPLFLFSIHDLQNVIDHLGYSSVKKDIILGIMMIACWRIWKMRNEKIFKAANVIINLVLSDIKSLSFLWLNSRGKLARVGWKDWQSFSFDVM